MSTRSSQPHRLFLPVVTPTSFPRDWRRSPMSWRQQGEQRQASVSVCIRWPTFRPRFAAFLNFFPSASLSARRRCSRKHSLTSRSSAPPPLLRSRKAKHPLGGAVWQRRWPPLGQESVHTYQSRAVCSWITKRHKLLSSFSYILLLWGEGADADSGGVGLHHPVHLADVLRGHAQSSAHATHCAVGWSHKRVCSCHDMREKKRK